MRQHIEKLEQRSLLATLGIWANEVSNGIEIRWNADASGSQVNIHRRNPASVSGADWGNPINPNPIATSAGLYVDTTASLGNAYEYRVMASAIEGPKYLIAGRKMAAVHSRGSVLLVIDETQIDATGPSLQPEIDQLQRDLIGEGYKVLTETTPRVPMPSTLPPNPTNPTPADVTALYGPWSNAVAVTKRPFQNYDS